MRRSGRRCGCRCGCRCGRANWRERKKDRSLCFALFRLFPAEIAAVFDGPSYAVTLNGTAAWYGSVAAYSFAINGGGNGGFHYDESLGVVGYIRKFEIVSSFEDLRK